jgi:hypothetical protein
MMERASVFTAQEFIDKLRSDAIEAPLALTGMVKLPEDHSTELMFAPGTRCVDWMSVPLDAIESVEVLDVVPCDDHTHPLVTLTFKAPESSEGALFAALLRAAVKRGAFNRAMRPLHTTEPTPRARLVTRTVGGFREPATLRAGGCAAECNEYEVDEAGHIYQLYSCKDYGSGIYVCYYE